MQKNMIDIIFSRRSIRKYLSESINYEDIKRMLEAAMAAPSGINRKPWHFIVVKARKTLDALAEVHPHGKMLFEAQLCIAVCGDPAISELYWIQDCSAATENLLLSATALGLGAVWLGVYPHNDRINEISKLLKIPKNIVPLNLISMGYPAESKEARTQYDETRVHLEEW